MGKLIDEAYDLLEEMASNSYRWPLERLMPKRTAGVHELDAITALTTQVAVLSKKFDTWGLMSYKALLCLVIYVGATMLVIGVLLMWSWCNLLLTTIGNNQYSNTYSQGWKNHPNFSWSNNHGPSSSGKPMYPSSFLPQAPPPQEKKPLLEDLFTQYMPKSDTVLQNQAASIRNLEIQMAQLDSFINNRPQGTLPSDTETNPKREGKEH